MANVHTRTIASVAVVLIGFAAVFGLSSFLERNRETLPVSYADEDLQFQGKRLKGYALGFEGLLADWYWMRSLQYLGDKLVKSELEFIDLEDLSSLEPRLLYPLLDNATDLDPKFIAAYSYGATVLPAIDPALAVRLTEKGIRHNPDEWRLYQYLGYIHWRSGDFQTAADVYERGSSVDGAPAFFELMAAKMRTESGSPNTARSIYQQMLSTAEDEQTRSIAQMRLMELDTADELNAINTALKDLRTRTGRCAASWAEIMPQLAKFDLPSGGDFRIDEGQNIVDPSGVPYILKRDTCSADIDRSRSKIIIR